MGCGCLIDFWHERLGGWQCPEHTGLGCSCESSYCLSLVCSCKHKRLMGRYQKRVLSGGYGMEEIANTKLMGLLRGSR